MIAEKKESKYALIQVRVFKEALAQAKETAAIRTAAEGREVTYNEVIRQQVETGRKVMAFQMNPTDAAAAAALLHDNATIAAAGAFRYFADNQETHQAA